MATAQHAAIVMPPGGQWCDANGAPLNGGKVNVYIGGTTTPETSYPTYDDALAGTNANANPVVLDAAGRAQIWLQADSTTVPRLYKLAVTDSANTPVQTVDDYNPGIAFPALAQDGWVKETNAVAYSSTVLFTVTGVDVTSRYVKGRRVKVAVTAGTLYGTVTDSTFASNTTVRVVLDSGTLDSGLSAVYYGLQTSTVQGTAPPAYGDRVSFVHAYRSTDQSITTGAFRKIQFDTEVADLLAEYDNATNYRWTPLYQSSAAYSQRYLITATVTFKTSITSASIAVARDGTNIAVCSANQGLAGSTLSISWIETGQAATGKYYEIFVNPSGNVDITGGATATFLQIARIP